ncbi:Uncharacterized protein PCOAH_00053470, partial [Plasmodium coatneyi]
LIRMVTSVGEGVMSTHLHGNETSNHVNQLFVTNGTSNQRSYEGAEATESRSEHSGLLTNNEMAQRMSLQSGMQPSEYIHHVLPNGSDREVNKFMQIYLNGEKNTPECNSTQFTSNQYEYPNRFFDKEDTHVSINQFDYLNDVDTNLGHFGGVTTMDGRHNDAGEVNWGGEQTSSEGLYMHMLQSGQRNEPLIGDPFQGDSLKKNALLRCSGLNGGVFPSVLRNAGREDPTGVHLCGDKPDNLTIEHILKRALLSSDILQNEVLSSEVLGSVISDVNILGGSIVGNGCASNGVASPQQVLTNHDIYPHGNEDLRGDFHLNSQAILGTDHLTKQSAQISYNAMNGGAFHQSYSDSYRPPIEGNLFYNVQLHGQGIHNENDSDKENGNNHSSKAVNRSCTDGIYCYYGENNRGDVRTGDDHTGDDHTGKRSLYVSSGQVSNASVSNVASGRNIQTTNWNDERMDYVAPCRWSEPRREDNSSAAQSDGVVIIGEGTPCGVTRQRTFSIRRKTDLVRAVNDPSFDMACPNGEEEGEGEVSLGFPVHRTPIYTQSNQGGGSHPEGDHPYGDYSTVKCQGVHSVTNGDTLPSYICEDPKGLSNLCGTYSGGHLSSLAKQMDGLHGGVYQSDSPHLGLQRSANNNIQCVDAGVKTEPMQNPPYNRSDLYPTMYTQSNIYSSVSNEQTNSQIIQPAGSATQSKHCSRFSDGDTNNINREYQFRNVNEEEEGPPCADNAYPYSYQSDVTSTNGKNQMENHLLGQEDSFNRSNVPPFSLNNVPVDSFENAYNAGNGVSSARSNSCEESVGRSVSMGGSLHEVGSVGIPLEVGATTGLQNQDPFSRNNTCSAYGRDLPVEGMQNNHSSVLLSRLIHTDMPGGANHHLTVPPIIHMAENNNSFNGPHHNFVDASTKCVNLRGGVDMRVIPTTNSGSPNGVPLLGNEHIYIDPNRYSRINRPNNTCSMQVDASNGLCPANVTTNQMSSYQYDLLTFRQSSSYYDGVNNTVAKGRTEDASYGCTHDSVRGENNYAHPNGGYLNSDENIYSGNYSTISNIVRMKGYPHVSTGECGKDSRSSTTTTVLNEEMLAGSTNMQDGSRVDKMRENLTKLVAMKLQSNNGAGATNGVRSVGCTGDMLCNPGVNPSHANYDCFACTDRSATQVSTEQFRYTTLPQMKFVQTGGPHRSVHPGSVIPPQRTFLKSSIHVNNGITDRRAAIPRMVEVPTPKQRILLPLILRPRTVKLRVGMAHIRTPRIRVPYINRHPICCRRSFPPRLVHLFPLRLGTGGVATTRMSVLPSKLLNTACGKIHPPLEDRACRDEQTLMMKGSHGENTENEVTHDEVPHTGNINYGQNGTGESRNNDDPPMEKKATKKRSRKSRVKRKNKVFGGIVKKGGISFDLEVESRRIKETPFCAYSLVDLLNSQNAGRREGLKTTVNEGKNLMWCSCDMHHDVNCFTDYVDFLRGRTMEEEDEEEEQEQHTEQFEKNDRTGGSRRDSHIDRNCHNDAYQGDMCMKVTERHRKEDTQQMSNEPVDDPKGRNSIRKCDNVYYNVNKIWSVNFNRPLGDIGRKLILKEIRELHYKDAAKTTSLLMREGLDYGKVRFMKVSELYHYMYALGVFEYAVKISLEFGSNIRMSSVVTQGNYRSTCNNLHNGYDFCFICCSHKNPSLSYFPVGFNMTEQRMHIRSYSTLVEEFAARCVVKRSDRPATGRISMRKFLPPGHASSGHVRSDHLNGDHVNGDDVNGEHANGDRVSSGISSTLSSPCSALSWSPTNAFSFRTSSHLTCKEDASPVEHMSEREQQLATQADTHTSIYGSIHSSIHVGMTSPDYATTCEMEGRDRSSSRGSDRAPSSCGGASGSSPDGEAKEVNVTNERNERNEANKVAMFAPSVLPPLENRVLPLTGDFVSEGLHPKGEGECQDEVHTNGSVSDAEEEGEAQENYCNGEDMKKGDEDDNGSSGIAGNTTTGNVNGIACSNVSNYSYGCTSGYASGSGPTCYTHTGQSLTRVGSYQPYFKKDCLYMPELLSHPQGEKITPYDYTKGGQDATGEVVLSSTLKGEASPNWKELIWTLVKNEAPNCSHPGEEKEGKSVKGMNNPHEEDEVKDPCPYIHAEIASNGGRHFYVEQAKIWDPPGDAKGDHQDNVKGDEEKLAQGEKVKEVEREVVKNEDGKTIRIEGEPPKCDDFIEGDREESELHTESEETSQSKRKNKIAYRSGGGDLAQTECMHRYEFPNTCGSHTRGDVANIIRRIKKNKVYTSIIKNLSRQMCAWRDGESTHRKIKKKKNFTLVSNNHCLEEVKELLLFHGQKVVDLDEADQVGSQMVCRSLQRIHPHPFEYRPLSWREGRSVSPLQTSLQMMRGNINTDNSLTHRRRMHHHYSIARLYKSNVMRKGRRAKWRKDRFDHVTEFARFFREVSELRKPQNGSHSEGESDSKELLEKKAGGSLWGNSSPSSLSGGTNCTATHIGTSDGGEVGMDGGTTNDEELGAPMKRKKRRT